MTGNPALLRFMKDHARPPLVFLVLSFLLAAAAPLPAQDWSAIFKLNWQNRTKAFKEQNLDYQNVVLVGDSITEGFSIPKFFPGRRVLNRGISGDVIGNNMPADDPRGLLQRLDDSIFDSAPSEAFLLIGINDLQNGRSLEAMKEGYRQVLTRIRERMPLLRLHVQSLLPTSGKQAGLNPKILEFNRWLKQTAPEFSCDYVDLHSLVENEQGELRSDVTSDGLHLNDDGYKIWSAKILDILHWN